MNISLFDEAVTVNTIIKYDTWKEHTLFGELVSVTDLVYFLKTLLKKYLESKNEHSIIEFHKRFCKYINIYANELMIHSQYSFEEKEFNVICLIVNSVELLHLRLEQFETEFNDNITIFKPNNEHECLICFKQETLLNIFNPCHHLVCCEKCLETINDVCPVCRQKINSLSKINI